MTYDKFLFILKLQGKMILEIPKPIPYADCDVTWLQPETYEVTLVGLDRLKFCCNTYTRFVDVENFREDWRKYVLCLDP